METLARMVDDGKSQTEIAEFFKCHPSHVNRHIKKLPDWRKEQLARNPKSTSEKAIDILDLMLRCNGAIVNVHDKLAERLASRDYFQDDDLKYIRELSNTQKEMREQMKFYTEYISAYYTVASVVTFQERVMEMLEEIKGEHPEVAVKIAGLLGSAEFTD